MQMHETISFKFLEEAD